MRPTQVVRPSDHQVQADKVLRLEYQGLIIKINPLWPQPFVTGRQGRWL